MTRQVTLQAVRDALNDAFVEVTDLRFRGPDLQLALPIPHEANSEEALAIASVAVAAIGEFLERAVHVNFAFMGHVPDEIVLSLLLHVPVPEDEREN